MDVDDVASKMKALRIEQLGFKPQKELVYNKLLPYAEVLDDESKKMFAEIKANLGKAFALREMRPASGIWTSRLGRYMQLYGFKFSKEEHIALVKLMYECITIPNLDPYYVLKFSQLLYLLLKKKHLLSPDDLTLEWRPLYDLVRRIIDTSETQLGMYRYYPMLEHTLDGLMKEAQFYFPETATKEILDELKPRFYPLSVTASRLDALEWFLPVCLPPAKAHLGYKLWLHELMDMWATCNNAPVWEYELMSIIAKLAHNNIGQIDWEPYLPDMFARFIASFNLPVNFKKTQIRKAKKIEVRHMAQWIVSVLGSGSSCQQYLDKFLKAIETYFHPANSGRWLMKLRELLLMLPYHFVGRLHMERYRKPSWLNRVPESHRLTEEDIDRFVESMKSVTMHAVFSKQGSIDVCLALQHLATIRPKSICPDLIDRFYLALDSLTEPHKLTSVMQAIVGVARPLVEGPLHGYPEGPTHIIPMLMATLPGIDPNDFRKCVLTFQFIQTFVTLVPLVDCSKASETWTDLTEEEEEICTQTADMEDFVCQFFDRVFVLIENSTLETTRLDKNDTKRSRLENVAEKTLTAVCYSVLTQTSKEIFQSALKKLVTFVTERILETQVAGHSVASLCNSFSRVNSTETFKALLPRLCGTILTLTEHEDVLKEHDLDNELLYNLLVLSAVVECRREGLVPYMDLLTRVLDKCLYLVCREGYVIAASLLWNMLVTLTTTCPTERRSLNYEYVTGDTKHLPIRDWGKPGDIHELDMAWHVPSPDEVAAAQSLVTRYLPVELDRLSRHISGEEVMTRVQLLISLNIVSAIMGAEPLLPLWEEPPVHLIESTVDISYFPLTTSRKTWLTMPDGSNVRLAIAHAIDSVQGHLLRTAEDHTDALLILIQISERLLQNRLWSGSDYEGNLKNHHLAKKMLTDQLVKGKRRVRTLLQERIQLQHAARCERPGGHFTATHRMLMLNMLTLSCSHYSQVRSKAQVSLSKGIELFPYSYMVLVPQLVHNLQLNSTDHHETLKGSLYVILGPKATPIIARHDWSMLNQLWSALIRSNPSEKLSVVQLLEGAKEAVNRHFPTISIHLEIPDRCVESALELWNTGLKPSSARPSAADIETGRQKLLAKCESNLQQYMKLLNVLCDAAEDNSLHWRHHNIVLCLIRDLVHPDVRFPPRVVKIFLDTLLHDSIELRKIAIRSVVHVLKQQKRPHPKIAVSIKTLCSEPLPEVPIPGIRPDNLWLQYKSATRPLSQEQWDQPRYHHEPGYGYLQMPSELKLYAPSSEQPPLDRAYKDLTPEECPVYDFFSKQDNIDKLVTFLSLEEKKGKDKFNGFRFILFKSLFRNHGDTFLPLFKPHLDRLVADSQESSQRCSTEIIAGVIRGSKHWPYDKVEALWAYLKPLTQNSITRFTEETMQDWGICYATASQNRDPNRNHWLMECLMEDLFRNETSFMKCGRLYALQGALNQQEWRVAELMERLLTIIKPYLDHPFDTVRRRIASVLTNIFQPTLEICGGKTLGPRVSDFMASTLPRLEVLHSLSFTAGEHKAKKPKLDVTGIADAMNNIVIGGNPLNATNGIIKSENPTDAALRLFKTLVQWVTSSLARGNGGVIPEYYSLYPLTCLLESYDQDEEIGPICTRMLAALAPLSLSASSAPSAFAAIQKVAESGSWWARSTNLDFLQVLIFHSMPVLRSREEWVALATELVLNGVKDPRVEVREKAAGVLAGLIHCEFINDTPLLLDKFSKSLRRRGRGREAREASQIGELHTAVLGLCAFVNSAPYDVPDFVPHIFTLLGSHLNDPQPIPSTIRKTLGDFKRTHHDNWESHKLKFTDEQLEVLTDLIVPPSYCV